MTINIKFISISHNTVAVNPARLKFECFIASQVRILLMANTIVAESGLRRYPQVVVCGNARAGSTPADGNYKRNFSPGNAKGMSSP